jgi:hypothetical protein
VRQLAFAAEMQAVAAEQRWEAWLDLPAFQRVGDERHGDKLEHEARRLRAIAMLAEPYFRRWLAHVEEA